MKRNVYYQRVFSRPQIMKQIFLMLFMGVSYYFRLPIEIIIRKSFGERYFDPVLSLTTALAAVGYPFYICNKHYGFDWQMLFEDYSTWFIYWAIYFYHLYKRWLEVRHEPSVFDFGKFSLSDGIIPDWAFKISALFGKVDNPRFSAIFVEPAGFFIGGAVLTSMDQPLGKFLMTCAVVYSFGYMAAYRLGDQAIMDTIDEMLCNEDLSETFIHDNPSDKGIPIYGRRPSSKEMREKLFNAFKDSDEDEDDDGYGLVT